MAQSPPTTLGKYQIIREIARSNDIVYEAYDPVMNRRVAVKELAMPHGSGDSQRQERIKRFHREAKAAGSLAHPNIVTLYEVGQEGDRHFIAMEFLDGHNLRNELDTKGFLEPKRAIEIALAVLNALEFSHSKGVIHRDIKPDNVQILSDGRIKLTDFGIARLTFEPNLTMDGQVFGTPSYMSPEQINGKELDQRSDLFGLGVILFEMVSGEKPFQGDSVVSITYSVMNKEPSQPQQCPWSLWQVIRKTLDKSPQLRQSDAKQMAAELEQAKKDLEGPVQSGSSPGQTYGMPPGASMQSGPPPVVNPYAAGGQTGNPYAGYVPGQPPSQGSVYAPPGSAPPQVQPGMTSQAPYGQGGMSYQPYTPGMQPGYTPPGAPQSSRPPVYYPPPPRQPLMKPETKRTLAQAGAMILLLGLLLWLVVVGLQAIVEVSTGSGQSSNVEGSPAGGAASGQRTAPTDGTPEGDRAARLSRDGKNMMAAGDYKGAESAFLQAIELAPSVSAHYTNLASLYENIALDSTTYVAQSQYHQAAGEQWAAATVREADQQAAAAYRQGAANAYYRSALAEANLGNRARALALLTKADTYAAPNTEAARMISELRSGLNG